MAITFATSPTRHATRLGRLIGSAVFIAIPVLSGLSQMHSVAFRDNVDVFADAMTTPLYFLLPLALIALTCLGLAHETQNRFASSVLTRRSARSYLVRKYAKIGGGSFLLMFLFAFVPFLMTTVAWPAWGNPGIDPGAYMMSPAQAAADSLHRFSFSQLLASGQWVFGIAYSLWCGFAGAAIGCLGVVFLVTVKNRFLALILPFIVYFVETIAAALIDFPHLGLVYSVFPFGLDQVSIGQAAAPVLVLALIVAVSAVLTLMRARHLDVLS